MTFTRWFRLAASLVAVALVSGVAGSLVTPSPAQAANTRWIIESYISDFNCMEVQGQSEENSAQIQMYECADQPHKEWYMLPVANTTNWKLVNVKSGLCANVQGNSGSNNAKIIQYSCGTNAALNSQWKLQKQEETSRGDYYYIRSASSDLCMNVKGASVANGADIIQYSCGVSARNDEFTWQAVG